MKIKKNMPINILLLSSVYYDFYISIVEYLRRYMDVSLYCILEKDEMFDSKIDNTNYNRLSSNKGFNDFENINEIISFIRIKQIDIILNPNIQVFCVDRLIKRIRKECSRVICFDLVHSCTNFVVKNKRIQLKELKWNSITSLKMLFQYLFPNLYLFLLQQIVMRRMLRSFLLFDKIILLSPSYVEEYKSIINCDNKQKVISIPNLRLTYPVNIPIKSKKKEMLFVGRLSEEKAFYRLLYIWGKMYQQLPDWSLIVVGDGPKKKDSEILREELGLERVYFKGKQSSISFIENASILCLVSNFEGLPTVFIEAMSFGTVPVGFDSFSAIYDMIDNWENGVIVPAFDLDKYAECLIKLAKDDELRYQIAYMAKEKVKQYDIEKVAEMWKIVLEGI